MSEQIPNQSPEHERQARPIYDDCSNCEQRYQLTPDNTAGRIYPKQAECSYLLCVCPNCNNKTRIFCNDVTFEVAALNDIHIFDDEPFADDNVYSDWLELKGIELPKSYELTDRHEKMIGAFATALATVPDEHLYDLITDEGYNQPYPQRWI